MIRKITIILFIMLFAFHTLTALPVECDKGVIPFGNYIVEEPGQKAIIGWNGSVEVLILSNDLLGEIESYSGFKGKIQVLEILPLPSLPKIEKGSEESFRTLISYINFRISRKGLIRPFLAYAEAKRVTVEFQVTIGPHFITVVKAENGKELEKWIMDYAEKHGLEKPKVTVDILEDYINRGYKYFAVDIVTIENIREIRTVEPLVYIFKSDKIFYPLKISGLTESYTEIKLFIVSKDRVRSEPITRAKFEFTVEDIISLDKLREVDPRLASLFKEGELWVTVLEYRGSTVDLTSDVETTTTKIVLRGVDSVIAFITPLALIVIALSLLFRYYLAKTPHVEYSKPGYVITAASLLLILGVLLIIPYSVLALKIIEPPILPYIKPGPGKVFASLIIGAYVSLGILSLVSVILIAKKRLLGLKLGLASTIIILLISITYASTVIILGYLGIYYTVMGAIIGLGALSSIIALLSLIFIGLSWNHIKRK